mgnify:CR=1 FL=1
MLPSGARIATTLVHALRRTGARRGLCTMCIGVGQGIAALGHLAAAALEGLVQDGITVSGYLAEPAGAPVAGLIVIQEWWGLNAQIRGVADRYAEAGYVALVPDLYRGKSTVEAEEAHHLMTGLNFGEAASQDVSTGDIPPFVLQLQAWPYDEGLRFVTALAAGAGATLLVGAAGAIGQRGDQVGVWAVSVDTLSPEPHSKKKIAANAYTVKLQIVRLTR